MGSTDAQIFDKDKSFWDNYVKGRPKPPLAFFERIFDYHKANGGSFVTVHDVGAGSGPFASMLASRFDHVILSDVAASSLELAKDRLGTSEKFTYRVAKLDEIGDLEPSSVDLVFATNVMHFASDQKAAMKAMAEQLKPGGTFACAVFGPATFADDGLQSLWSQICHQGAREVLSKSDCLEQTALVMARTDGLYNVAPLDPELFVPGAMRLHFNMGEGGLTPLLPPEMAHLSTEPYHSGPHDVKSFEDYKALGVEMDKAAILEHMLSFPFVDSSCPAVHKLLQEVSVLAAERDGKAKFRASFPAKLILATAAGKA